MMVIVLYMCQWYYAIPVAFLHFAVNIEMLLPHAVLRVDPYSTCFA